MVTVKRVGVENKIDDDVICPGMSETGRNTSTLDYTCGTRRSKDEGPKGRNHHPR